MATLKDDSLDFIYFAVYSARKANLREPAYTQAISQHTVILVDGGCEIESGSKGPGRQTVLCPHHQSSTLKMHNSDITIYNNVIYIFIYIYIYLYIFIYIYIITLSNNGFSTQWLLYVNINRSTLSEALFYICRPTRVHVLQYVT